MMKRTDGGGGRGITLVRNDDELRGFYLNHNAVQGGDLAELFVVRFDELRGFYLNHNAVQGGDLAELFVVRFLDHGRHVETQCGRDTHGEVTVYSPRDGSVQRRNQQLIEEAPAPFLDPVVDEPLLAYSRRLVEAVQYVGLGTCEFMVTDTGKADFLEVNPRLQVEHTVSDRGGAVRGARHVRVHGDRHGQGGFP